MSIIDNLINIEAKKLQTNIFIETGELEPIESLKQELLCKLQYAN